MHLRKLYMSRFIKKLMICTGLLFCCVYGLGNTFKATDNPDLMPYYTGHVYPKPQKAIYKDQFFPLNKTGIMVGKNIKDPQPLVDLIVTRIKGYKGNAVTIKNPSSDCSTIIALGDTELSQKVKNLPVIPDQPQAYIMLPANIDGKNVIILQGKDRQGLLWAVSSFNDLVFRKAGKTQVRAAEISDYPVALSRGYLHGNVNTFYDEHINAYRSMLYNVTFKLNKVVYKHLSFGYNHLKHLFRSKKSKGLWRDIADTKMESKNTEDISKLLTPLGIEWYGGFHTVIGPRETIMSGSPDDIKTLMHYARQVAKGGGNFYMQLDDFRFPMHKYDIEHFGTARKADFHILSEMDKQLREDYPDAKILVCQPFYWGPVSGVPKWYGEDRDKYLKAISKLPPSVEMQWTGPKVQSSIVKKEHTDWIRKLIKRKPVIFQNGWGSPHPLFYHYTTDPVYCWPEWLYDGYLNDVDGYLYNTTFPGMCALIASIADYSWNPKGYKPEQSIKEAVGKLVGLECFDTLDKLNKEISWFDQFDGKITPYAMKQTEEMEKRLLKINQLWNKAKEISKAVEFYTGMGRFVKGINRYVNKLKNNPIPKQLLNQIEKIKEHARKETNPNEKLDIILTCADFVGGVGPRSYANNCEKRTSMWVYGTKTKAHTIRSTFPAKLPPKGDYKLILTGLDDEAEQQCNIKISVNNKTIYEGPSHFKNNAWSTHSYNIPAKFLNWGNTLTIQVTDEGYTGGAPWIMLEYAVIKRTKQQ